MFLLIIGRVMVKNKIRLLEGLLVEKNKEISQLHALIKKNDEKHQADLQKKINYYENILALMPGHVYWLDRNNTYLGCNDNQAKQVMLASRHDIVGKKTSDLLSNSDHIIDIYKLNNQIMETGVAHAAIEYADMADGDIAISTNIGVRKTSIFLKKCPCRMSKVRSLDCWGFQLILRSLKKPRQP